MLFIPLWCLLLCPPPEPYAHLLRGLENPRYAVRAKCAELLRDKPQSAWWLARGMLVGKQGPRSRCQDVLASMPSVHVCNVCGGPDHCDRFTNACEVCGSTITVETVIREHQVIGGHVFPKVMIKGCAGLDAQGCDVRGHSPKFGDYCVTCGREHAVLIGACSYCRGFGFRTRTKWKVFRHTFDERGRETIKEVKFGRDGHEIPGAIP